MNIREKETFIILMAVIGCLIFNSDVRGLEENPSFSTLNDGLVSSEMTNNNLLTDVLSIRTANVKGYLSGPFVHAIYGHARNNITADHGYKNDMYGLVLGVDNVWAFANNEKFFRLGTALGCTHGTAIFTRKMTEEMSLNMNHSQDIYALKLFGAYESFNDKCLKTNFGVTLGYGYNRSKDELSSFGSHTISLGMEFIKNLCAYNGYQFGPWLQSNCAYILQLTKGGEIFQNTEFVHNFLSTVIGLNVEKETFKHADKKLILSLKTGWECRVMQRSNIMAEYKNAEMFFKFKYPVRNSAILSFSASQKLNDHWNIVGVYFARFNKDFLAHSFSAGIEYAF
jgi:hypothetical protein